MGFTLCHWTETLLHRSLSDHERATYLSDYSGPINFSQVFQTVLSKDDLFKYHKYLSKPLELSFYISRISLRVQRIIFLESIKWFSDSAWKHARIKSKDKFVLSEYFGEYFLEISWFSLVNFEKFDLTTRTNVLQFG